MASVQLDQFGLPVESTDETPVEVYENVIGIVDDPSRVRVDNHAGFQAVQFNQDADAANIERIYRKAAELQARAEETRFDENTGEAKYLYSDSVRRGFLLEAEQLRQSATYDAIKSAQRKRTEGGQQAEQTAAMHEALAADEARRQEAARLAMMGPLGRARENLKIK